MNSPELTLPRPDDDVHIRGALGTLRGGQLTGSGRRRPLRRLLAFLAIMGPGIIVMVGDNDAGGVTTYAQAGQAYGVSLLWLFPILLVVLYVAQEMVARLGAVTGVGHGTLLRARFGRFWATFSVFDLFVLNFLTLLTEFIGIDLGFRFFGVSPLVSVPVACLVMGSVVLARQFYRWEQVMLALILVSLLVFPMALLTPIQWGPTLRATVVPGVQGGLTTTAMIFVIGIVGTTIAPWQLFFQQGSVVDKRISARFANYARVDTLAGSVLTNLAGAAFVVAGAFAFLHTPMAGGEANALGLAHGFAHYVRPLMGRLFAILLLEGSLIGAATVTLASSYAVGELFGVNSSLNARFAEAKGFYSSYLVSVVLAGGIVLLPHLPLGLVNLGVQVLAGILLPSALGFLVLLCNDGELLGPWVNAPWLNVLATLIVGLLLQLSLVLTVATIWPSVDVTSLALLSGIPVLGATVGVAVAQRRTAGRWRADPAVLARRGDWTPAPGVLDHPLPKSRGRSLSLGAMRAYLVVAMVLMVVSFARLAH